MSIDIYMKVRNEFINGPELRIYRDEDVEAALANPDLEPFALNPNYFTLYTNATHSLLKVRMENSNLWKWMIATPVGMEPFSWEAVNALGFANTYMGLSLEEAKSLWSELNATYPAVDELGVVVGTRPLVEDTLII